MTSLRMMSWSRGPRGNTASSSVLLVIRFRFSFGLGKRSSYPPVERYLGLLRGWGMGGPHGLFKRGQEEEQQWEQIPRGSRGWWGLSGPHGLFKKSGDMEPIKRGAYSFGNIIIKLASNNVKLFL